MTHDIHDPGSVQDLTFVLAQDRIAGLRASTPPARQATLGRPERTATSRGIVARGRDAIGRRLITLGGTVVADEGLRRRALHR